MAEDHFLLPTLTTKSPAFPCPTLINPASSRTPGDGDECVLRGPHTPVRPRPVPLWRPWTRGRLAFDHELYGETEKARARLLA